MASVTAMTAVFCRYKCDAKRAGREWALTRDQAVALFTANCHYCGTEPAAQVTSTSGTNSRAYRALYNGIDRVDNSRGYTADNVVTACKTCNYAKRLLTRDQFLAWVMRVATYQREFV